MSGRRTDFTKESLAQRCTAVPESGCWLWTEAWSVQGYGVVRLDGKVVRAHRVAWELYNETPACGHVLHKCDTPACVNPEHLYVGTQADNFSDMRARNRNSPPPRFVGGANLQAKLTDDDVRAIRASAEPLRVVAKRFGVSTTAASYVRRGESWRHVA